MIRRRLYVHLSNLEDVKEEFKLMLHLIQKYFSDNFLNIPEGSTDDILCTLRWRSTSENTRSNPHY